MQNKLRERSPGLIGQELQRQKAREYEDNEANKTGILAWMRKNDESPLEPPAPKPSRPKSVADGNPSEPSDDS